MHHIIYAENYVEELGGNLIFLWILTAPQVWIEKGESKQRQSWKEMQKQMLRFFGFNFWG